MIAAFEALFISEYERRPHLHRSIQRRNFTRHNTDYCVLLSVQRDAAVYDSSIATKVVLPELVT
jgi:hypothetical protein